MHSRSRGAPRGMRGSRGGPGGMRGPPPSRGRLIRLLNEHDVHVLLYVMFLVFYRLL